MARIVIQRRENHRRLHAGLNITQISGNNRMKASAIILSAAILAAMPAHAELRTLRVIGTVFDVYRQPDAPSLLPVPDPSVGDAYQLDIVYDTEAQGFNTFETCMEYAAIKSVTVTMGAHSAKLAGPASVTADTFWEARGWITACDDSVTYHGDTVFIHTVGVFGVVIDLRGVGVIDDTVIPSAPSMMAFPSRYMYVYSPSRAYGSPVANNDAFFGTVESIVSVKNKVHGNSPK
jgi:hypothetical protein